MAADRSAGPGSTARSPSQPKRNSGRGPGKRRFWRWAVLFVVLAGLWGLWQIDLVRQNVEIVYMSVTGGMWKLRGREVTVSFDSPTLREKREAIVYLPPGYDAPDNRSLRYATLYLLHGFPNPGGYDSWVRYGRAPQETDRLIVQKQIPPVIVVCPDGRGKDGQFGDSEFLDPVRPGVGSPIATYIDRDVVSYIDRTFRTRSSADARVLGGVSTGGYGAANLALQHPEIWGSALCLSGYYEADPRHFAAPLWGPNPDPAALKAQSPLWIVRDSGNVSRWRESFFFVGEGGNEPRRERQDSAAFTDALKRAGVPVDTEEPPGKHSWDVWRALLRDGLVAVRSRLVPVNEERTVASKASLNDRPAPQQ